VTNKQTNVDENMTSLVVVTGTLRNFRHTVLLFSGVTELRFKQRTYKRYLKLEPKRNGCKIVLKAF